MNFSTYDKPIFKGDFKATVIHSNCSLLSQVPVKSWFDDVNDSELLDLIPLFEKLSKVDSVYSVLCNPEGHQTLLQSSSSSTMFHPQQQMNSSVQGSPIAQVMQANHGVDISCS